MGNKKSFPAHFPYPAPPDADAELPGSPTFADAGGSSIILSPVPHTQPPVLKDRVNHQRLRQQTKRKSKNVVRWRAKLDKHRPEAATEAVLSSVVLTGPNLFEELPDEILCHLLGFLFQDTKVALLPSPVAAMLVCSRWYRVIGELQLSPVALPWRRRRDEIVFRRRPDYVKRKVFTTAKRSKYEGEWVEEFGKHGKGKLKYPDGDMYQGEWLKDKRHGYGVYIWSRYICSSTCRICD